MKLGSGAYEGPYSFHSRFESASGTNPEELIGAAEAGCFSMALSSNLEKAGHPAKRINTTANVKLEMVDGAPRITTIDLQVEASVPGINDQAFQEQAKKQRRVALFRLRSPGRKSTSQPSSFKGLIPRPKNRTAAARAGSDDFT